MAFSMVLDVPLLAHLERLFLAVLDVPLLAHLNSDFLMPLIGGKLNTLPRLPRFDFRRPIDSKSDMWREIVRLGIPQSWLMVSYLGQAWPLVLLAYERKAT